MTERVTPTIPFFVLHGLEVDEAGPDGATCRSEVRPWLDGTPELGVHGATPALADSALMYAASARAEPGTMFVTVDMRLDFWSPPPPVGAHLVGTGRVESAFGDAVLIRGRIAHGEAVVATATLRALLVPVARGDGGGAAARPAPPVELVPPVPRNDGSRAPLDALLELPAARLLGLQPVAVSDDAVELTATPAHELERTEGVVHGGAIPLFGSLASAVVLRGGLPADARTRRLDLSADFLRPTPVGAPVRVRSRVAHRTRRVATVHTELATVDGKPTARIYETVEIEVAGG